MNEELTPVEEQAIDAMLSESLGNVAPPDLSRDILVQLHESPTDVGSIVCATRSRGRRDVRPASKNHFAIAVTVVAAIAATVMIAVWLQPQRLLNDSSPDMVQRDSGGPVLPSPMIEHQTPTGVAERAVAESTPVRKPPKGIPLVVDPVNDDSGTSERRGADLRDPAPEPLAAVSLVSNQVDSELRGYWDAIGIQVAGDANAEEIADRLSALLGITLPIELVDHPERLRVEIGRDELSRAIATRWLQQITERGLGRIDAQAREELVDELVACFQLQRRLDHTIAGWIDGTSSNSPAFYQAISLGSNVKGDDSAIVRRLASLTMNVDLRCTRCHDSYIEGNGRQEDYWAFTAFLRRGVTRGAGNHFAIDAPTGSEHTIFYELTDVRQRAAEPAIARSWIDRQGDQPIDSVGQWAEQLVGSPELARGVVNSLWQLVHGQPLRGRVVDPISAPHNEALDRLEEHLTRDLIRSRFDVARTLALVIASPATRRAVPASLLAENVLSADEQEMRAAMDAVDAFAAVLPPRADLSMRDRLDETMRAIGASIDTDNPGFVGQIGEAADNKQRTNVDVKRLSPDFPSRAESLPVQWLTLIEDDQSQVEHLAYLAGQSSVPDTVATAAAAMREANVSPELLLHRVWWMLRP